MKIKKIALIILSTILMCIPTQIFAWLQYGTYEACNPINVCISWLLKIVAVILAIVYITGSIQYMKHSQQEPKQKSKNVLTGLIIVIVQIVFLVAASLWVTEIGMETYWSTGERFQFNEIDGYISNGIRIVALIAILVYMVTAVIYSIKSKQENIRKIENIIKFEMITAVIVAGLLIFARNW